MQQHQKAISQKLAGVGLDEKWLQAFSSVFGSCFKFSGGVKAVLQKCRFLRTGDHLKTCLVISSHLRLSSTARM